MLPLWTFLVLSVFFHSPQAATTTPTSKNIFAIQVDPSVNAEELQVRYFMTGDFGGLGGFQVEQRGEHRIVIHTEEKGMAAKTLKIAFYAPHCQIQTTSVDDLSESSREVNSTALLLAISSFKASFLAAPRLQIERSKCKFYISVTGGTVFLES